MTRILILSLLLLSQACNHRHSATLPDLVHEILTPPRPVPQEEPAQPYFPKTVQVANLSISQQETTLVFTYDLNGHPAEHDEVILEYSRDQGQTWHPPTGVSGDLGPRTTVGTAKKITWQVLTDFPHGINETVEFRLESLSERSPDTKVVTVPQPTSPQPTSTPLPEDRSRSKIREPLTGMELIWVEGGCFRMGCNPKDGPCRQNEGPSHQVCLDGFFMGTTEVTQGQWRSIMKRNPSKHKKGKNYPVENVSWYDVREFMRKLNRQSPMNFRLPTEAEWEFACRSGGRDTEFCGNGTPGGLAWYRRNSKGHPRPVAAKEANSLGLYDMSGNVWEWVFDKYATHYPKELPVNPRGPANGAYHVLRGGSWSSPVPDLKAVHRTKSKPGSRYDNLGFRLVLLAGKNRR